MPCPCSLNQQRPQLSSAGFSYWPLTAGFTALANPGAKTGILAYMLRFFESSYIEHLRSKCPSDYITRARTRLKNYYSRTMTFAAEYLAKFRVGLSYLAAEKFIFIDMLVKSTSVRL